MRNFGLLLAMGVLLTGAAPCGGGDDDDGDEGGSQGGGSDPGDGVACGPTTCDEGQVCCNESCGICTDPGGFCTEQFCGDPEAGSGGGDDPGGEAGRGDDDDGEGGSGGDDPGGGDDEPSPVRCGGITGDGCPGAGECVDDESDDCDPENGGADCGGLCACSGAAVLCGPNTFFDDDPNVCACVPHDGGGGEACGATTCEDGMVCCNASCGICTEPGGFCTQQACEPIDPPGALCDLSCEPGFHCELVEVTCIQAPCPPQPECVASPQCGGFAGFTCEGEGECVDTPDDGCDPENGGADCGGYCVCTVGPLIDCAPDHRFDPSPAVCACVKGDAPEGEACGDTVCAADEVCCNASCGICTPPDGACTQQICG
jgi:hypothetical protein